MSGTSEGPTSLEQPAGVDTLTEDELTSLANNLKLHEGIREVFRVELALRRLQSAINAQAAPPERVFEVRCRGCRKKSEVHQRLLKGVKLSGDFPFTCKECTGAQSLADTPDEIRSEEGKETSRRWRENNREKAAEYKRRQQAGDGYVESRKELMSDEAWEAKLKEFGYACSTPSCGRPLTLKTAIHSADGPTYVPICRRCLCRKAAKEKWRCR